MAKTTFKKSNATLPAPKWWRNLEDGLLMILIPAIVLTIQGWDFKNEAFANKLTLIINVLLVALIKFIGKMLANGEVYAPADPEAYASPGPGQIITFNSSISWPNPPIVGVWYYDKFTKMYYYYWDDNGTVRVGPGVVGTPKNPPPSAP